MNPPKFCTWTPATWSMDFIRLITRSRSKDYEEEKKRMLIARTSVYGFVATKDHFFFNAVVQFLEKLNVLILF